MIAKVSGGHIVRIAPDRDNPHRQRRMKGRDLAEVAFDKDHVTTPLKRLDGPSEFEPVGWNEAVNDIVSRLEYSIASHGIGSFAMNTGNPPSMGRPSAMGMAPFQKSPEFLRCSSW